MPRGGPIGPPPGGVVGGGVPILDAQPVPAPLTAVISVPAPAVQAPEPSTALSAFQGAILVDVQPVALPPNNFLVVS